MTLTVTVLVENRSLRADLAAGRGLALHLDDGRQRILFDTGPDGRLIDHAERLGIDLAAVDTIVLSHGHYDHSGGLPALADWYAARGLRPRLVAHPDAFVRRGVLLRLGRWIRPLRELGAPLSLATLQASFDVRLSHTPEALPGGRWHFIGQVPRRPAFAGGRRLGWKYATDGLRPDGIEDDSGLVWQGDEGLVVISGCAHSGICNLTEQAREITGIATVQAVLGGFHLRSAGPVELWRTRKYFRQLAAKRISACHCSGWGRYWLPGQQDIASGSQLEFM
ncbi:MBL fold metallo-hydrolase [Paludibacterium purpuratum]|uniref:7, 8-dihydropterin-6-yl-methyl-4-(Beta-D-ribofuranosyl)aminobenzene 5'-phosphate synthase n=1 Tax=Paludibacterium purpuratum TaxID=1144873 RepID=A0A4R7B7I0_9NEIS|nr:MBL fold metallo-hydrolase [Paludibacterium purpuratum]TDR79792.1 7,8-dihydropterin-6-yl-methyl-4-(beta-D-ribofuranosyl)aminobenzene 5'-phosphate synthase [Paludibacterium purpuratum]